MPVVALADSYVDTTHVAFEVVPITDPETSDLLGNVYRVPVMTTDGTTIGTVIRSSGLEVTQAYDRTYVINPVYVQTGLAVLTTTTTADNTALFLNTTLNITTNPQWAWGTGTNYANGTNYGNIRIGPPTAAERRRTVAAARKRKRASVQAAKLLAEHLTDQENAQLATDGYFEIESLTSGRRYRIYRGYSRNIVELDATGLAVARLCAHPSSALPDEDHMLAQRLWLQSSEDEFRRIANISPIGTVEAARLAA
jgi:hypothetical protein